MFRLHDSTRRLICVAAFLGLCALPTFAVSGWAVARRLPWNRQAESQRLAAELGVAVSIEPVAHTLPGVIRYTGLKLSDPETGLELLRCAELDAAWTSMTDSKRQTRPAIELTARQIDSSASAWPRLKEMLRRSLECQCGQPEVEVRLTADEWTLHDGNESQVLKSVVAGTGLNLNPYGFQGLLEFRLANGASRSLVRMRILRNREVQPPAYHFDLETDLNAVPQSVAALIQTLAPTDELRQPGAQPREALARRPLPDETTK